MFPFLLICLFSIQSLGKVFESNYLFERERNNNHLVLSTFRDSLFDLKYIETFSCSTFTLAKKKLYQYFYGTKINFYHQQT